MNWDLFLTFSGYILFVLGSIFSLFKIKYELKKRKEFEYKSSIRDKRFSTYNKFLSKLDVMNSELYEKQYNEESMNKINNLFDQVKADPNNISGYHDIIHHQSKIIFEWMEKYNKYLDELNQLRLVGSPELILLLDEYQNQVQEYLAASAQSLAFHSIAQPGELDLSILESYGNNQLALNNIRRKIENQMKVDIGNT